MYFINMCLPAASPFSQQPPVCSPSELKPRYKVQLRDRKFCTHKNQIVFELSILVHILQETVTYLFTRYLLIYLLMKRVCTLFIHLFHFVSLSVFGNDRKSILIGLARASYYYYYISTISIKGLR